jgi:hypothetical protein
MVSFDDEVYSCSVSSYCCAGRVSTTRDPEQRRGCRGLMKSWNWDEFFRGWVTSAGGRGDVSGARGTQKHPKRQQISFHFFSRTAARHTNIMRNQYNTPYRFYCSCLHSTQLITSRRSSAASLGHVISIYFTHFHQSSRFRNMSSENSRISITWQFLDNC